ncbi:helix-turn-helix domain-containing protein [Fusibacter paucivorans]|uniref:Helix-turn-helix domain-containing protein n=1 Tax=Fusibacter paucivorans TaxID=76009 RepID=A0ABS5PS02_9FIRM|nr:helix-turn-helix domain-containing protein [Fusibacter paucivorans]MBS7527945.1 helix-turn-helix domain-containing protein [Fusibacter paucivorans]
MKTNQYDTDQWRGTDIKLALSMQKLYEGLCANKGLQYLIDQIGELFERPLILYDTSRKVLAATNDAEPVFHMTSGNEICFINEETVSWIHSSRIVDYASSALAQGTLCITITIDVIKVAELAVYEADIPFQEFDFLLINKLGALLSTQLQRSILLKLDHNQIPSSILADLIEGKPINDTILNNRGRYLKWARTEALYIAVVCDSRRGSFEGTKSAAFQALKRYIPIDQMIIYESSMVAFFDQILYDVLFDNGEGTFQRFLAENNLYAGISQRYAALTDSRKQYRYAIAALEIGLTRKRHCSFFNQCTLYILSELVSSQYDLMDFCHPAVTTLLKYDEEHGTVYFDTLKQYIYYASAPAEAARILNIHKNTLFYRIKKIKELTGITLDFGDEISKIFLSIRLLELN